MKTHDAIEQAYKNGYAKGYEDGKKDAETVESGRGRRNKISYEERTKVYDDAITTFGANMQLIVALEEMSELQKEICKELRGNANRLHLAEELADVTIMLEQVRRIFHLNEDVCKIMDGKILRLRQRIENVKAQMDRGDADG